MYRLASPSYFIQMSSKIIPWLYYPGVLLFVVGLVWGLAIAPQDYQQGDAFRIIYVHVPAAALSMAIYMGMAFASLLFLVWRIRLAGVVARCCVPVGAIMTLIALVTGSLWGKPMWGTYWLWDPRLTSELILLFLFLGFSVISNAFDSEESGMKAASFLALIGVVNIPVIHYSVRWWNSLHQDATIFKIGKPSIDTSMLWPLLIMMVAFILLSAAYVFMRSRNQLILVKLKQQPVNQIITSK
jgi:heme exporter protein C